MVRGGGEGPEVSFVLEMQEMFQTRGVSLIVAIPLIGPVSREPKTDFDLPIRSHQ